MPSASIKRANVFEDGGASLMARVVGNNGASITQAGISTITYAVYDLHAGTEIVASTSLTVSAVVFDTLQTDARWTEDTTGYNFRHDIAANVFTTGDLTYRVEYKFTPSSGAVWMVLFEVSTIGIMTT